MRIVFLRVYTFKRVLKSLSVLISGKYLGRDSVKEVKTYQNKKIKINLTPIKLNNVVSIIIYDYLTSIFKLKAFPVNRHEYDICVYNLNG